MWWIMIGTVAAVHARLRRSVAPSRPGVGASSRRRKSMSGVPLVQPGALRLDPLMRLACLLRASTLCADGHDGRGAHPEGSIGILDLDAHRESGGKTYPVDRLLDAREAHDARGVLREHRPPKSDHGASEALARLRLKANVGRCARPDVAELRLAEVPDHVPRARIHEREDVRTCAGECSHRNVEIHDAPGEG